MASLADYVLRLARDRKEAERFRTREEAIKAMREHGISEEHQQLLLNGDHEKISAAIMQELHPDEQAGGWSNVKTGWTNTNVAITLNVPCPPKPQ
jgi:hypothetical protein